MWPLDPPHPGVQKDGSVQDSQEGFSQKIRPSSYFIVPSHKMDQNEFIFLYNDSGTFVAWIYWCRQENNKSLLEKDKQNVKADHKIMRKKVQFQQKDL